VSAERLGQRWPRDWRRIGREIDGWSDERFAEIDQEIGECRSRAWHRNRREVLRELRSGLTLREELNMRLDSLHATYSPT
jgi:hypothetical protein